MHIGFLTLEIFIPDAHSLKEKRFVLRSLKDRLRKFNISIAECGHQDLWQRSTLAVACAAREHHELQDLLDAVVRYLGSQDFELLRAEREVVVPGER